MYKSTKTNQSENSLKNIILGVIVIAILVAIFAIAINNYSIHEKDIIGYKEVRVTYGDTVWDICCEYCPNNIDLRVYINYVESYNHINSNIYPGDIIYVPLYK